MTAPVSPLPHCCVSCGSPATRCGAQVWALGGLVIVRDTTTNVKRCRRAPLLSLSYYPNSPSPLE